MRISILFIFTLIIFTHCVNTFAQQAGRSAAEFEQQGVAAQLRGDCNEALAAYKQSLEKKPNFTVSPYQLAGVYVRKRELRSAIDPLRKLLAEEPTHEHGIFTLGQVYAALGDNDGAMQQYYTLQNLNPRLAANLLQQISK